VVAKEPFLGPETLHGLSLDEVVAVSRRETTVGAWQSQGGESLEEGFIKNINFI
jgi:hypothetical protein